MHKQKITLIVIILIGGIAVLGSYAWGILAVPNAGRILWGDVPDILRILSTIWMLPGALGYFAYTYFILFRLNPDETHIYQRFGYGVFSILYIAILIPSALWLPLTSLAVSSSSPLLDWVVRLDLVVVGLASLALLFALLHTQPRQPMWAFWLAVIGCVFFCIQTVILDAILWGAYFQA